MSEGRAEIERMPTGVPNLDAILGGGIPLYSVNLICGAPGSGKTVLTHQVLFKNATDERKALYITTLSEPTIKVVRYQQQFSYFDPEAVGRRVFLADIGEELRAHGLEGAMRRILDLVREHRPALVAIDSFKAIHDLAPSPQDHRRFVYELAVRMAGWRCTTLLVGEYAREQIAKEPEFAVADGVIWLEQVSSPEGPRRFVEVLKMRGTSFLPGRHSLRITSDGIEVYPRVPPLKEPEGEEEELVRTGLDEVDEILGGGLPRGGCILVSGEAGTGKTILSLQFLWNGAVRFGERGLMFLYEEPLDQVLRMAGNFGWDFTRLEREGLCRIIPESVVDLDIDRHIFEVGRFLSETGAKRVVFDSISALLHPFSDRPGLIFEKLAQMVRMVKAHGATALFVSRVPSGERGLSRFGAEESLCDGIIVLRIREEGHKRRRTFEVYKLRTSAHVMGEHRMIIGPQGIEVLYALRTEE